MKKKLAAILSVCLVLSSALISCGNDGDDDSSSKKNKSSISSDSEDPKYNENDDDENETTTEDDTEEDTTAEITTEAATEKEEPTTKKSSSSGNSDSMPTISRSEAPEPSGGNIIGLWGGFNSDNDAEGILAFEENGTGSLYADLSSVMYFKKDRSLYMQGLSFGKNSVSYDGSTITVKMDPDSLGVDPSQIDTLDEETAALFTQDILVLKRTGSSDASTLDGEYKFAGGIFSDTLIDSMSEDYSDIDKDSLKAIIKGESFLMKFDNVMTYSTSGNKLTISSDNPMFKKDFDESSVEYTVEGDTLYLYSDKDEDTVAKLDRVTF